MRDLYSAIIFTTHLIIPVWFIFWIYRERKANWMRWFSVLTVTSGYILMMYLGGSGWDWVGTFWPAIFLYGFLGVVVWSLLTRKNLSLWPQKTPRAWLAIVLFLMIGGSLFWEFPAFVNVRQYEKTEAVALQFPLKKGLFDVRHGGSSQALNHHFFLSAQRYALDVVKLNKFRTRASGLFPGQNEKYEIYAEPVYASCDGEVIAAQSELIDLNPPEADAKNLLGNFISLYCESLDVSIMLAHLKQNSLVVNVGSQVKAGQLLAQVGNTGNTSEPHLHFQAVKGRQTDFEVLAYKGQGLPMTFDGRFLIRGDTIIGE